VTSRQERIQKETGTGEAESTPLTPEEFRASPEFARFKHNMEKILKVSKAEVDRRMRLTKVSKRGPE
jgi:hypothetical protein